MKAKNGILVLVVLATSVASAKDVVYRVANRTGGDIRVAYGVGSVTQDAVFGTGHFSRLRSRGWRVIGAGKAVDYKFDDRLLVYFYAKNPKRTWVGKKEDATAENFCIYDGDFDYKGEENGNEKECLSQLGTEEGKELHWARFLKGKPGTIPVED
jgi:hypothetical protein